MSNLLLPITTKQPISRNNLSLTPTQYFASNFNDITQSNFATMNSWSIFTGTDSETGYAWAGKSGTYPNGGTGDMSVILNGVTCLNDDITVTGANYTSYCSISIASEAGPDGTNENVLTMDLLDAGAIAHAGVNSAFGAQMWLMFTRIASSTSPLPADIENLYVSYHMKKGTYLNTMAAGEDIIFEEKTGGYGGLYGGDQRLAVAIVKPSSGSMYWRVKCDHSGNGSMTVTPYDTAWPGTSTDPGFSYFKAENNTIPVPVNDWCKFELFLRRSRTDGCLMLAIDDQVAIIFTGNTMGEYNNPIGRLSPHGIYSQNGIGTSKIARLNISNYPSVSSVLYQQIVNYLF